MLLHVMTNDDMEFARKMGRLNHWNDLTDEFEQVTRAVVVTSRGVVALSAWAVQRREMRRKRKAQERSEKDPVEVTLGDLIATQVDDQAIRDNIIFRKKEVVVDAEEVT
jgi:hypothetical protein